MPHMDEGRLQAWLDGRRGGLSQTERDEIGAHVASCEACADRVAELRGTDAASRDLLGALAEAEPAMPDFSDVVARSRSLDSPTRKSGTPARRRFPIQWAASIVVAVGVGWMANEVARNEPRVVAPQVVPSAATAPEAGSSITDETEASLDAGTETTSGDPGGASANSAPVGSVTRDADPAPSVETPAARPAVEAPPTPVVAEALAASRQNAARENDSLQNDSGEDALVRATSFGDDLPSPDITSVSGRVTGPAGDPLREAVVSITGLSRSALSGPDGRFRLDVPSDSVGPDARLQASMIGYAPATRDVPTGPGERVIDDLRMERRGVQLEGVVVTGTAVEAQRREVVSGGEIRIDGTEAWERVSPDRAASVLGARPLRLPDLTVTGIDAVEVEGTRVVRVTHEDADRGIVHLYQAGMGFRIEADVDRPRVDRTTASGIYLSVVGALDPAALRDLLDRAEPIG